MISVLMSVYKKENPTFLKASLDSIYAQTLKADEIVLVEDGEILPGLEEVISQCSDFHVVKLERNLQLGRALEAGLKACQHELLRGWTRMAL